MVEHIKVNDGESSHGAKARLLVSVYAALSGAEGAVVVVFVMCHIKIIRNLYKIRGSLRAQFYAKYI